MPERKIRKSARVTFGGIIAAISLIIMLLSGAVYGTEFALPLFAGLLLIPIAKEMGKGWAFLVYFVVTIISFIIIIRPEPPIVYASLLGYYPIIRETLEKIRIKWIRIIVKLLIANASIFIIIYLTPLVAELFGLPLDNISFLDKFPIWVAIIFVVVLANVFFLLYDSCINKVNAIYMYRFHDIFAKIIRR